MCNCSADGAKVCWFEDDPNPHHRLKGTSHARHEWSHRSIAAHRHSSMLLLLPPALRCCSTGRMLASRHHPMQAIAAVAGVHVCATARHTTDPAACWKGCEQLQRLKDTKQVSSCTCPKCTHSCWQPPHYQMYMCRCDKLAAHPAQQSRTGGLLALLWQLCTEYGCPAACRSCCRHCCSARREPFLLLAAAPALHKLQHAHCCCQSLPCC